MGGGRGGPPGAGEGRRAAAAAVAAGRGHNRKSRREPPGPAPCRAPPRSGSARPPPGALCAGPGPGSRGRRAHGTGAGRPRELGAEGDRRSGALLRGPGRGAGGSGSRGRRVQVRGATCEGLGRRARGGAGSRESCMRGARGHCARGWVLGAGRASKPGRGVSCTGGPGRTGAWVHRVAKRHPKPCALLSRLLRAAVRQVPRDSGCLVRSLLVQSPEVYTPLPPRPLHREASSLCCGAWGP